MNIKKDMKRINKAVKKQYKNHSDSDIKKVKAIRSEIDKYYTTEEISFNDLYKRLKHINVVLNSNINYFLPFTSGLLSSEVFSMCKDIYDPSLEKYGLIVSIISNIFMLAVLFIFTFILLYVGYRSFYLLLSNNNDFAVLPYEKQVIAQILETKYNFTLDYNRRNEPIIGRHTNHIKVKLHKSSQNKYR